MSACKPALVRKGVEGLALPKSVESGKLSLNKAGIRWMSAKYCQARIEKMNANEPLMRCRKGIDTVKTKLLGPSLG